MLVLGTESFECADELPVRTLIRYASGGLEQTHFILKKLVRDEDLDRMWDSFEAMPSDDAVWEAIGKLFESYSDRPTARPSPSELGSSNARPS